MLIQFAVENFRSIGPEVLLNLYPAKSRIHPDHVLISEKQGRKAQALPLAALYGANASGKSNLVGAIATAQDIIVGKAGVGSPIPVTPFLLHEQLSKRPSRFEFTLKHEDVFYTYGFSASTIRIEEEWLFAVLNRKEVRLFERVTKDGAVTVEVGNKLAANSREKQRLEFIAEGLQPNQLFLSEAAERNVPLLEPLMYWFKHRLKVILPDDRYQQLVLRANDEPQFRGFLNRFVCAADTGMDGLQVVSELFSKGDLPEGLSKEIPEDMLEHLASAPGSTAVYRYGKRLLGARHTDQGNLEFLSMQTRHHRQDGTEVFFAAEEESDGTHRMLHLAPALYNLTKSEDVYVIDEFDRSLHPNLCLAFLRSFLEGITGGDCRGQIILTTHETSILRLDLLRRDEVWFVEKDRNGASHISSLAEFDVRSDLRVDKGYINGRFGAIPFVGELEDLLESEVCD